MDQVTQQNAAMVEETTAVTHRLSDESNRLTSLVQRFRLADTGAGHARAFVPAKASAAAPRVSAGPVAASAGSAAQPSPAKGMVNKLRQAFSSGGSAAAEQEWSEF